MGACISDTEPVDEKKRKAEEKDRSKAIEKLMSKEHGNDQQINKLLLLGAGESGKSTLFKQMITIYGKGYPEKERKTFAPIIYNNIITAMKVLCHQSAQDKDQNVTSDNLAMKEKFENEIKNEHVIDENIAKMIKVLWEDAGIQKTFRNRAKFQLTDSAPYFFDKINEIAKKDYIPIEQDVLRSRVRTTGIVENAFDIDGNQFKMFDVGGQRNERKKWIHCFENVTAVLFVAAISEYDQVLYEDENTNRMVEALNLFEEICNSRWFRETSMILFLNKRDLFQDKIQTVSLRVCFETYDGPDNYEAGCEFLQEQFESRNRNPDKQVYTHITCATDTDNISAVFNAVKDIIIRKSLTEAGLV